MRAGDVLSFADFAITHGATAWRNPVPRRAVLTKYISRSFICGGASRRGPSVNLHCHFRSLYGFFIIL
jgi:ectoine hydroxylase-related dioxygenase (phytanoyl-CoA dioxygenase family)